MMKRLQVFVPFEIWGLPGALRDAWAMPQAEGPATAQYASQRRAVYMHPDKLMALRRWILGHPLASVDSIAEHGRSLEKVDSKQLETIDAGRNDRSPKTKKRKRHDRLEFKDKQKIVLDRKALPVGRDTDSRGTDAYGCSSLLRNHDLQHVGVGESMSTKMNYVLHEVPPSLRRHATMLNALSQVLTHKEDKFLIFSSSPLSLAHMSEGMSLARISHLKIMSQVDPARWAGNAMTFQSEDSCQCLLMEIRYGARGLCVSVPQPFQVLTHPLLQQSHQSESHHLPRACVARRRGVASCQASASDRSNEADIHKDSGSRWDF